MVHDVENRATVACPLSQLLITRVPTGLELSGDTAPQQESQHSEALQGGSSGPGAEVTGLGRRNVVEPDGQHIVGLTIFHTAASQATSLLKDSCLSDLTNNLDFVLGETRHSKKIF